MQATLRASTGAYCRLLAASSAGFCRVRTGTFCIRLREARRAARSNGPVSGAQGEGEAERARPLSPSSVEVGVEVVDKCRLTPL